MAKPGWRERRGWARWVPKRKGDHPLGMVPLSLLGEPKRLTRLFLLLGRLFFLGGFLLRWPSRWLGGVLLLGASRHHKGQGEQKAHQKSDQFLHLLFFHLLFLKVPDSYGERKSIASLMALYSFYLRPSAVLSRHPGPSACSGFPDKGPQFPWQLSHPHIHLGILRFVGVQLFS